VLGFFWKLQEKIVQGPCISKVYKELPSSSVVGHGANNPLPQKV